MATIRKRGAKWQVQIRRVGHRFVSRSFYVLKDAEAWARQIEVQADRGELPGDPKILNSVTLGQLVERYRDTVSVLKRGYDVERIVLSAFLRHPICRKRLSEIQAEDFVAYRDARLQVVQASTLKRELSPLHNLFELARDEWGLPLRENPLSKVRVRLPPKRRERRLRNGELDKLVAAARTCRNQLVVPIIQFAVATGMRRGEILTLKWEQLDRERRSLLVADTKNGHARIIPMSTEALDVIGTLSSIDDRVFPVTANAFRLAWDRLRHARA